MEFNVDIKRKKELCDKITNYDKQFHSFKDFNNIVLTKLQDKSNNFFVPDNKSKDIRQEISL